MKKLSLVLFCLCFALPTTAKILSAKSIPANAKMDVELIIPTIETSIYARPYVAVWIEDAQRKPVRTLQLWVGKDEWLKDIRSWWRKVGRYDRVLVDAVTSATRPAGKYRFSWDGLDHDGHRVEQGDYTFYVEVVREHGGRNYLRQKLTLAEESFTHELAATEETGVIRLQYHSK
ncbi:DUF2271 domain-containing protein [Psychromonas sp. Urea-02u-13]|uniref:DUF2271 domain-containing protein n=1 Tax=Psychromonas sp. Urea-02u-13 TaxID=2058326 RepID=UPI000C34406E|nr:DUF2271 domain-containing protein [Psychromonas sp. Urea-02u-13]PKG38459.1 DUF2271 domain-containing protein [Psychromonas sp. Urea-02u-13]